MSTLTSVLPLTGTASDFEIAIRGEAMLDSHLQHLLSGVLYGQRADHEKLFRAGRLKTLAYCIGLLSQTDYADLRIVSDIRNSFAHPKAGRLLSFDDAAILALVDGLSSYRVDVAKGLNGRAIFIGTVYRLASQINHQLAQGRLRKARQLQEQRAGRNEEAIL